MNDEWIEDTIYWCATFGEKEFIQVNRTELLAHMLDLRRLREVESLAALHKKHENLWNLSEKLVEACERQPISDLIIADAVRDFMNAIQYPKLEVKS